MKRKIKHFCLGFALTILAGGTAMVSAQVQSIEISVADGGPASIKNGQQLQLKATVYPETEDQTVTWDSFNEITGTVDANGLVTGNIVGTATIRATAGGVTKEFPIDITQPNNDYTEVGVGTSALANQSPVPVVTNAKYSYVQSLHLGGDLATMFPEGGEIAKLRWYYNGETKLPNEQHIVVYLGNTTKSKYLGNGNPTEGQDPPSDDWVPVSQLTKVYEGPMPVDDKNWVEITLDAPFHYDGSSNIVVATNEIFNDNDDYDSTMDNFYAIHPFAYRSIYQGSMDAAFDPAAPTEGKMSYYIPDITFIFKNEKTSGCTDAPNGMSPSTVYNPSCDGTTETISDNAKTGEYSKINLTAGTEYTFSSSVNTDFITIANEDGTQVLAYGTGSVTFTATENQTIRYYLSLADDCSYSSEIRSKYISCAAPSGCEWTVHVHANGFGDEINWTLKNQDGITLLEGGSYMADYDDVQTIVADGPLEFHISNDGQYGDNVAVYSVSNGDKELVSGTLDINNHDGLYSDLNCETMAVENPDNTSDFKYYPNPVNNILKISSEKNIESIAVYSMDGKLVVDKIINSKNPEINVANLVAGVYVVIAKFDGNQTKTFRIIKK